MKTLRRPMFRRGGSTGGGITSGLQRKGFSTGSSKQRIIDAMGMAPPKRNFNDFLINFGLDIASRSPQGNIFQTAALSAKDPYDRFAKARDVESNLMRQVGMESEIMDINKENAAAAAAAKDAAAMSRLQAQIQADKDLYKMEQGNIVNKQIEAEAAILSSPDGGIYNTYQPAENHATWKYKKSKEKDENGKFIYDQSKIAGVLTQKQVTDAKTQAKFAKKQGKKNGVGNIYYDPFGDRVLEVAVINGEYVLRAVGGGEEVIDTTTEVVDDKGKSVYEQMTGTEPKTYTYEDYLKDTEQTTQKIKDVITTPVDMSEIDTTNIRRR